MTPDRWLQVKEIFHEAVELQHEERRTFLLKRCEDDPEMLRELELLMESHEEAGPFIERPAMASASDILLEGEAYIWAGRTLGRYRVLRELGHGGMGLVLLAVRADDQFKKQVAIKILRRGMDSEEIVRRFRTERQILASLEHPNIARLLDGGITEDGLPYIVMEYIEGQPVDSYCDKRRLRTDGRLLLFRKICSVVEFAHQNLIIHRDLKPSNILITPDGEPKLLDFGIAKLLNPALASQTLAATATDLRLMTPEYASPEQIRGHNITTVSDVYSLGILLYRLLSGHAPYHFKQTSPQEIERLVCENEPERPSTAIRRTEEITIGQRTIRITPEIVGEARGEPAESLRRRLRGDLDNIVLKALRKEPERRYSSAAQFAEDIRRYMDGLPVTARKDTFAYRASKFIGRNRIGVAAVSLVLLAILAGLTASIWQARVAARERNQAQRETARADQLNNFLKSILSAASPEQKGRDVKVIEVLNGAAARIDTEFANQPELRAQVLQTIGQTYFDIGLMDEAEKYSRESLKLNLELYGAETSATADNKITLGSALLNKGKLEEAEQFLTEAVAVERKLSSEGSKELALGLFVLGELYVRRITDKEALEKAKQLLQESISIFNKVSGENNEDSAYALVSLARAHQFTGDLDSAEATYRKSIAIFRTLPQHYELRMAMALLGLGRLLSLKGKHDEGINATLEAYRIARKQGESVTTYWSHYYLCMAYYNKGDYARAIEESAEAMEIGTKLGVMNSRDFAYLLSYRGLALTHTGRAKEAEPLLRKALDQHTGNDPRHVDVIAASQGALGECLTAQARYSAAEPLLLESYENLKTSAGADDPGTKLALRRLVTLYENWKKPEKAAEYRGRL
ncbi:MAG TPA: tetratricopeptide repeat protein [Pyrinomonadaceae bacterium]|jgi:serine/threonine protein kinase